MQYAAIAAMKSNVTNNATLMKKRLDFIRRELEHIPCDFIIPDGGMYYFLRFKNNIDVNKLIFDLLNEGVAVSRELVLENHTMISLEFQRVNQSNY